MSNLPAFDLHRKQVNGFLWCPQHGMPSLGHVACMAALLPMYAAAAAMAIRRRISHPLYAQGQQIAAYRFSHFFFCSTEPACIIPVAHTPP